MPVARDDAQGRRGRGFTLVELLVIVSIIALLLSILAPSFRGALIMTRHTICQSNLGKIGQGMLGYVGEYRHYPGHASSLRHDFPYAVWPTRIRRYTGHSNDIFMCAEREGAFQWQRVSGSGNDYAGQADAEEWFYEVGEKMLNVHTTPFSYAYNDWGNFRYGPQNRQRGLGGDIRSMVAVDELHMSLVANPGALCAIGDGQQTGSWDFNLDPGDPWEAPAAVHRDGANIAMADGHVEWALRDYWTNVSDPNDPACQEVIRRWNNNGKLNDEW